MKECEDEGFCGAPPRIAEFGSADTCHPRIRRVTVRGAEYITAEARPGTVGAERFAHERALLAHAEEVAVMNKPVHMDADVIVHRSIDGTTLHDVLLNSWPQDDEIAFACGAAFARLHSSPAGSLPSATAEQPRLFPLMISDWATTPDSILAVLVQCGHVEDWGLLSDRRRLTLHDETAFIHSDFKPDNIFLIGSALQADLAVRVIDWELAGLGLAVEDFAALFAGVTVAALQSELQGREIAGPEAMHRAVRTGTTKTIGFMQDAHAVVVDAIANRMPDAAARASRAHLDALKAGFA